MLKRLKVSGLLSFGPKGIDLELQPLNVFIGPNGSGKSNIIEILALLKALPGDFRDYYLRQGGYQDFVWKGRLAGGEWPMIGVNVEFPETIAVGQSVYHKNPPIRHLITLYAIDVSPNYCRMSEEVQRLDGKPIDAPKSVDESQSLLAQVRDPQWQDGYLLQAWYKSIRLYRSWWKTPPGATENHVFLMVQVMETWLLADHAALKSKYGKDFNGRKIPQWPELEGVRKGTILQTLGAATAGRYAKGQESFELLAATNANEVKEKCACARQLLERLGAP